MSEFLKPFKNSNETDVYDDLMYYDNNKIREVILKQNFLISKGYFCPKDYFPSIKL